MTFLISHLLSLLFFSSIFSFRLYGNLADRLLCTIAIIWANIVITSLLLSCFELLGHPILFMRLSIGLSITALIFSYLLIKQNTRLLIHDPVVADRVHWKSVIAFVLTLLPILIGSLLIAVNYQPNNYDSMTYHLPRVMFYLGQGTLEHFETENLRQIFFPFNLSILHLAILQHGIFFEKLLTLLNLVFWMVAGIALYRVCRLSQCSTKASLAATWLALSATQVLAQATATTNDLPTGAILLIAVVFFQRWLQTNQKRDAHIFAMSLGLAFGTKLTVIFFIPAVLILLLVFSYRFRASISKQLIARQGCILVNPLIIFMILALPFILYNIKATGYWMTSQFDFTLNKPFSFNVFLQTSAAYLFQFFLEPLHRFIFNPSITGLLNHWAEAFVFPNWNPAYAFSPLYLFPPDLNEDHVWFGFAGGFVIFCALFCIVRDRKQMGMATSLAIIGLCWLLFYFALNKWSLYIQRYFVLPFLIMIPSVAYYFDKTSWDWRASGNLVRKGVLLLFITSFWFSMDYLIQNTARPLLPAIVKSKPKPQELMIPGELSVALSKQPLINMVMAGGNERVFPIMRASPTAVFTSNSNVRKEKFNLISRWAFTENAIYHNIAADDSYKLLPLFAKNTSGVEVLGSIGEGVGEFSYFGLMPNASKIKSTLANSNILVNLKYKPSEPERFMATRMQLIGLNLEDHLEAAIYVEYPNNVAPVLLAKLVDDKEIILPIKSTATRLMIEVRDLHSGLFVAKGEIKIGVLK